MILARWESGRPLDRPRRERVAAVVDPSVVEPGGAQRRRPVAVTEPFNVDVPPRATGRGRRVETWRHRVKSVEDDLA